MEIIGGINPHSDNGHFYVQGSPNLWKSLHLFGDAVRALEKNGYKLIRLPGTLENGIVPNMLPEGYPTISEIPLPCGFVNRARCLFYHISDRFDDPDDPVLNAEWEKISGIISKVYDA